MTLGEFQDIGAVINGFASDDATVVMGTAIDESLDGEIRVTVVATGLGQAMKVQAPAPAQAEIKVVKPAAVDEEPDYSELAKPAVARKPKAHAEPVTVNGGYNEEMLDIPAFLRRQAD
jgi:cell division protein FtsZ